VASSIAPPGHAAACFRGLGRRGASHADVHAIARRLLHAKARLDHIPSARRGTQVNRASADPEITASAAVPHHRELRVIQRNTRGAARADLLCAGDAHLRQLVGNEQRPGRRSPSSRRLAVTSTRSLVR